MGCMFCIVCRLFAVFLQKADFSCVVDRIHQGTMTADVKVS